jgi:hypothetical protein
VFPPLPKGLDEAQRVQGINTWETTTGPEGRKRSVYVFQRRSLNLPLLETFDAPVFNSSCDRRQRVPIGPVLTRFLEKMQVSWVG